ncbi:MFS transporter [Streptococcus pluranimalium]|uniref:MFS transporter n=1 Tax=Streptococcus pluranimalium TaxID=82348 RepID=A0A2L0D640_9STRE|nr:MFS transporter [Streptococcus pluranimalium]AUW97296.1 MFS transporter [Streptococcus pluranimalium]
MSNTNVSTKTGLIMFFTLVLAYITFAASWVGGSNLSAEITNHYFGGPVSPVISQVVNYTITIARAIANFLAAYFLIKLGIKRASTLAFILLLFSLVAVWMPNYWFYIIARMFMALGGSMIMVYMNPLVVRFIQPKYKLMVSSLITATYNIGAFFVAVAFLFFADAMKADWRITLTIIGLVSASMFLIWMFKAKDFDTRGNAANHAEHYSYSIAIKDPFIWRFSVGFGCFLFLYVMSLTSLPSTLASAFSNNGFQAGLMLLAVSGGGMVATLIMMKLPLNRPRKPYLVVMGISAILVTQAGLFIVPSSPILAYALFFITGLLIFLQYPVFLNLPHELPDMNPQKATLMFGIIWALTYGLYTILTFVWSLVLANFGLNLAHLFYALMTAVYVLSIFTLPETYRY